MKRRRAAFNSAMLKKHGVERTVEEYDMRLLENKDIIDYGTDGEGDSNVYKRRASCFEAIDDNDWLGMFLANREGWGRRQSNEEENDETDDDESSEENGDNNNE